MATNFKAELKERECEGCGKKTGLMFYADICHGCAIKRGYDIAEPKWYCTEHKRKEVELYCKDHNKAVCQLCALTDHNKTCNLKDIMKAMSEKKRELESLKCRLRSSGELWEKYDSNINQKKAITDTYLMSLRDQMNSIEDKQIKREDEKEKNDQDRINDEANEAIRQINEKREERLKQARDNAEKRRRPIHIKRRQLGVQLEDIVNKTRAKFDQITDECRKFRQTIGESCQKIEELLLNDRALLVGTQRLLTSLADIQEKTPDESKAERVVQTVTGVKFEKGTGGKIWDGRYINYETRWELADSINIPTQVKNPFIAGCIEEDQVIITDFRRNMSRTFLLNLTKRVIYKVLTCGGSEKVMTCTCLDEDKLVCGKWEVHESEDEAEGCISVYDRQWRLIREINLLLPRNATWPITSVFVDVDQDGMIRAANEGQSNVYVIDPSDGKITKTIKCKQTINMQGILSTGDIVAQTGGISALVVIDGEGQQIRVASSLRDSANVGVDRQDRIYHLQYDYKRKKCVIDELSSTGDVQGKGVISFPLAPDCLFIYHSRVMITPLGKLIVSNGRKCLVYRRQINLE